MGNELSSNGYLKTKFHVEIIVGFTGFVPEIMLKFSHRQWMTESYVYGECVFYT